jgi:hypothetical protein
MSATEIILHFLSLVTVHPVSAWLVPFRTALAVVPFHGNGAPVLCRLTTVHGNVFANACVTWSR